MNMTDKMVVHPGELNGAVCVPPSKSLSHRAILAGAMAEGESRIDNIIYSQDIDATLNAISEMGAWVEKEYDSVFIKGVGGRIDPSEKVIHCGESGSTLRFMIPIATALCPSMRFEGSGRLVTRPINDYFPIFKASDIQFIYDDQLPLITTGFIKPGRYRIRGDVSSQYVTGLLMAAPLLDGITEIEIEGELESKAYVDLTLDVLKDFGIGFKRSGYQSFEIEGVQSYQGRNYYVEGDYSQSVFWIVAAMLGGRLALSGLNRTSAQGDRAVLDTVISMGGHLSYEKDLVVASKSATKGIRIDASEIPDLIPALSVLAAFSEGETTIFNGDRLRIKESDRIASTVDILSRLGADVRETADGMVIVGKEKLEGGVTVQGHGDHRIVMAAAVAATHCRKPVTIEGCGAVKKSYPHFFETFRRVGGRVDEVE